MTDEAPHVPAAFINAISEEGTKAEAVAFLQKQWNENRVLWHRIRKLEHDNNQAAGRIMELEKALAAIVKANPLTGHLETPQTKIARAALSAPLARSPGESSR